MWNSYFIVYIWFRSFKEKMIFRLMTRTNKHMLYLITLRFNLSSFKSSLEQMLTNVCLWKRLKCTCRQTKSSGFEFARAFSYLAFCFGLIFIPSFLFCMNVLFLTQILIMLFFTKAHSNCNHALLYKSTFIWDIHTYIILYCHYPNV